MATNIMKNLRAKLQKAKTAQELDELDRSIVNSYEANRLTSQEFSTINCLLFRKMKKLNS